MKKAILLALFLTAFVSQAQDAVTMLKFEEAEKAFNAGDFNTVLDKLDEVEEMTQPTPKTLYLRILSLNNLFDGGKLFNNPEQFEQLQNLRNHTNTYLEVMGNYELDDRFREVYQIGENLKDYPEDKAAWEKWNQEEDAKRNPKEYYPSGALKSITKTKEGSDRVAWEAYYENGQLKEEGEKIGEKKIGSWIHYNQNGEKLAQGQYWEKGEMNGKIGKWYYYYEDGTTKEAVNYRSVSYTSGKVRSHLWGEYFSWYENGKLKERGNYANEVEMWYGTGYNEDFNRKTGIWTEYYDNGQLKRKEGYGDNHVYETYYKSGQMESVKEYVKINRKIQLRTVTTYYKNGDLKSLKKYNYISDNNRATWESYHPNGQLKEEGIFKNGDKHGKWEYYDSNGNLLKKEKH